MRILFEAGEGLFIDLGRNDSYMFYKSDFKQSKRYTAPFDVLLNKRFANAKIESMVVEENNRIWRIGVLASSSYKAMRPCSWSSQGRIPTRLFLMKTKSS